ncbi:hypothetical protein [Cysteiniphilum litorale]|uniref:hypothetical protein n=1 Tax=Cysteiniphilum litorale TaxID=2056700 RepID=UPI003F88362A
MMKKLLIKSLLGLSLAGAMTQANATGWPTVDIASLTALFQQAQQAVEFFNEEIKMFGNQLNAGIQGVSYEVDTMNNGFANSIVRNEQTQNSIYNQKLAMQMQPSPDACASYSISDALNDATCSLLSSVSSRSALRASDLLNRNTTLSAEASGEKNASQIIEAARSLNADQLHSDADSADKDAVSPRVLRADLLMGSEGDTFDKTNMKATSTFNNIIVGPGVIEAPSTKNASDQLAYVNNYLRPNAIRALAASSLDTIRSLRVGQNDNPQKPSVMQLLQKFADSHFGTPEGDQWLKQITNTQKDASDFMSDSAVLRSLTQMQAYENYISVMSFQSQLRQEMLQAAMLTLTNKQVYGE